MSPLCRYSSCYIPGQLGWAGWKFSCDCFLPSWLGNAGWTFERWFALQRNKYLIFYLHDVGKLCNRIINQIFTRVVTFVVTSCLRELWTPFLTSLVSSPGFRTPRRLLERWIHWRASLTQFLWSMQLLTVKIFHFMPCWMFSCRLTLKADGDLA